MADLGVLGPANNRTCQICQLHEATHFCKCTGTPTLFCVDCISSHHAKHPRIIHQVAPIAALSQNPKEYKRRNEALMKATAELRSSVDRMEQCSKEFTDLMQCCIDYLIKYRTWWLQRLQTSKEELTVAVEAAVQEATNCLDQGVEPGSALARAMWSLSAEELQVFKYTVNPPDLPTLCQRWVSYENNLTRLCMPAEQGVRRMQQVSVAPAQPEEAKVPQLANRVEAIQPAAQSLAQLVHVSKSFLRFFDFQRGAWKQPLPLNLHIQTDHSSIWVILEGGSVFICGGGWPNGWSTVYVVGEGCVEQASMQVGRCHHGVLAYRKQVYVFGGMDLRDLNSCEKYQLQQHTWKLLPSMQAARNRFNPCLFNGSIYLCGYPNALLEAFSPLTDSMLPFQLSMPAALSDCCMYVQDSLLVVHLNNNVLKFRAGQAEQLVQVCTSSTQEKAIWQNSQPVVNATLRLYYIVQESSCYSVHLDTGVVGPAIK